MAMTSEAKVKAKVVKILKSHDVYYFFPATHGMGRSGVPDIVACVSGRFVAIECKAEGNHPTPLQTRELQDIHASLGIGLVICETNVDLLDGTIKLLKYGYGK